MGFSRRPEKHRTPQNDGEGGWDFYVAQYTPQNGGVGWRDRHVASLLVKKVLTGIFIII
ncbi:MAG TPA: hypothetical protein GX009_09525 [Candidatus Atribacteria bacterium]|jgi:hypothetical protein|nr:hypothetical protein [Candidatus Atribacteria bacterium]